MESFETTDRDDRNAVGTPYRGAMLLRDPLLNKGTAFTLDEREAFGLTGLLPEAVSTMDQQARRARASILRKEDALERYIGLAALQDRNEHLFYRVLLDDLEEFLPVVYTPVVGRACQNYSHIFRRARGLWITPAHRGRIDQVLSNAPYQDVRLIVVTDNERILGLGDQGAGGMGIPVGKLTIYTAAAGIHPAQTLPVSLDVGTDNPMLLNDDLYLGWRHPRLRGAEYDTLVEEFVRAVERRFPRALLQWEDFKKANAFRLLERYRYRLASFNDDIQGTAAVTLAAVLAAERVTDTPLAAERFVILGGGAAGVGIARLLRASLRQAGVSADELFRRIAILDSAGLLVDDAPIADEHKREFAWPAALAERCELGSGRRDLLSVVSTLHPTVLIGTSGQPGVFSRDVVSSMAAATPRPVIMPMSNPTSQSEATPADLISWTDGRALVATGSPFEPVSFEGRLRRIGQANNAFVFPAIGLASIVGQVSAVTDQMFAVAAQALAGLVTSEDLAVGRLLPRVRHLREVTAHVAMAVLRGACETGMSGAQAAERVAKAMWWPEYPRLRLQQAGDEPRAARARAPVGA